jgi:hypothetical protein
MNHTSLGLSDQIRSIAKANYIEPALSSGMREFSIAVRNLMDEAEAKGISTKQRVPAFCTSIQKASFLKENDLEIVSVDGPDSKLSTTVVVHYRRASGRRSAAFSSSSSESPEERAFRLTEKLRGLMKDEIAAHGGAVGYLRWVRCEDGDSE